MLVLWKVMQQMSNQAPTSQFNLPILLYHGTAAKNQALEKDSQ